jgi:hypothetical protein
LGAVASEVVEVGEVATVAEVGAVAEVAEGSEQEGVSRCGKENGRVWSDETALEDRPTRTELAAAAFLSRFRADGGLVPLPSLE